jgi:hypothetical protein
MDAPENYSLTIEYRPIDEIRPHPENPKGHALDELVAAARRFGFTEPLLECGRTGLLAAGHGRLEMTRRERDADNDPPRGVHLDTAGVWHLPVAVGWSSVDDDELRAYLVASNALGPLGGWQNELLAPLLQGIAETPLGLVGIGLGLDDLDTILAELEADRPDFQPEDGDDQPRLDRRFHLVCNNCGASIDPAQAERVEGP